MIDNRYLYAVGRTKVKETRLLTRSKVERFLEAKDAEELVKALGETDYAEGVQQMHSAHDYESFLRAESEKNLQYLSEVCPEKEVPYLFRLHYDVHNIKVLIKSTLTGEDQEHLLIGLGNIPVKQLKEQIKDKVYYEMPQPLIEALQHIHNLIHEELDAQKVDVILDKGYYRAVFHLISHIRNPFLKTFYQSKVDLINIKSFLRIRTMGYGKDFLAGTLLEQGKIGIDFYERHFESPLDLFQNELILTDYGKYMAEGIEHYHQTGRLSLYEKLQDNYQMALFRTTGTVAFGLETIVGYLFAREAELNLLRILFIGKLNHLSEEQIRERMRDLYV